MYNLRLAPIAVPAGRELAMSALADAPVVAHERRRASRPVRRGSGRLRRRAGLLLRQFAEQGEAV
jgi:hypothetical protein